MSKQDESSKTRESETRDSKTSNGKDLGSKAEKENKETKERRERIERLRKSLRSGNEEPPSLEPVDLSIEPWTYPNVAVAIFDEGGVNEEIRHEILEAHGKSLDKRRKESRRQRYRDKFVELVKGLGLSEKQKREALKDPRKFFAKAHTVSTRRQAESFSASLRSQIVEFFENEGKEVEYEDSETGETASGVVVLDHVLFIFDLEDGATGHVYAYANRPYNWVIN